MERRLTSLEQDHKHMSSALADLRVGQSKLEEKVQKLDKHLYAIIVGGGIFAGGLGSLIGQLAGKLLGL